ncbi:MAG: acetyl-CoA C-acyltransferase [Lewinellaceae bacterium]|nr:acetyl-CoA C-acyltransferase [Phaeodactylibacter sp.]MCB9035664.1 acetyl-CoA C-acyltransferase [Lewinellaceae bacterium]
MKKVYIVSAVRTPLGSFGGALANVPATRLGAAAIKGALEKAKVQPGQVEEVFMGNVYSANLGQAPARQAAIYAGIPNTVPCTTVNKVCSSGAKAIMFAAQAIMLGHQDIIVAGGMENMSSVPYYVPKARYGYGYGHGELVDGMVKDGLTDAYNQAVMGVCADNTAKEYNISREEQDEFAIASYKRSAASTESGAFRDEIVPVEVPQRKGDPVIVSEDEEYKRVIFEKIPSLRPVFSKDGTVTAANASTINDGAAALVLASEDKVKELGLTPVARIVSFADAAQEPEWFTTAPAKAAPIALQRAGLKIEDIDYFEVNEAFAVVALAFNKLMKLDAGKVNVLGGAVSLGHPLGASGARIITTLNNVLHRKNAKRGLAAICNGGGGASSIIIERV